MNSEPNNQLVLKAVTALSQQAMAEELSLITELIKLIFNNSKNFELGNVSTTKMLKNFSVERQSV